MATTAEGRAWTQRHRTGQLAIRAEMLRSLVRLWPIVHPTDLSGTIGAFTEAATVLVAGRRADSAGLAAAYFLALRSVEVGLSEREPRRLLAEPLPKDLIGDELRGAALAGIINARRSGQSIQAAASNGLVKVSGAATKLTLSGGQETILRMTGEDDRAKGWRRVTSSSPCKWCADRSVQSLRDDHFGQHDHCACTAEPQF